MSIKRSRTAGKRSHSVLTPVEQTLGVSRQSETPANQRKRHAARRSCARYALRAGLAPDELRELLDALGLGTTPAGLKQAIQIYQEANVGVRRAR